LKSGQSSAFSIPPSAGTECTRIHHRAVKKAPKNITSEKMNQLMLQRNDRSILRPYRPPSLSCDRVAEPLEQHAEQPPARPKNSEYLPHETWLTHWPAPRMTKNRPKAAKAGCREGCGT
jgi:hypothetical protein